MREDLETACRSLGVVQRFRLREHLERIESLLRPAETVRMLVPGWWRGHRSLVVLTSTRLLLIRRRLKCASLNEMNFPLGRITRVSVHPAPPQGARFRLGMGLDLEEFSVSRGVEDLERSLRTAMR